ncbi:BRCT domain-containing protein [Novosphingobium sp.]|uniref:BRCT domain-containing protein n=1 Tax=Novosphingobium sp. TaxID=1874826 RepID=UPI0026193254|nr:BRCT domain-containing protein [Novosphingobium sp.]
MDENTYLNQLSNDRLSARQIDELIGLARGLCADGVLNTLEVEFLQGWLAASLAVSNQPFLLKLYERIEYHLRDGCIDESEREDLFDTLKGLTGGRTEIGEVLKSTSLPLCNPPPQVEFRDRVFTFTGTFMIGQRKDCERLVTERGGTSGNLTQSTAFLVVGTYATESWRHSSMGNKIFKACEMRDKGFPIAIISENHWKNFL